MSSRHRKEDLDDDDAHHEDNESSDDEFQDSVSTLPTSLNNGTAAQPKSAAPAGLGLSTQDEEDTAGALPAMHANSAISTLSSPPADDPQQQSQPPQQPFPDSESKLTESPIQEDTVSTPPFWHASPTTRHSISYHSVPEGQRPTAILLEDHSEESHQQWRSCWAQSVSVDDHVLVSGPTGIGAYVVWHCTVKTLEGGDLELRKRYSDFDRLHTNLVRSFPHAANMIPDLPRKSVVSRFRPEFLENRRRGLQHFLKYAVVDSNFSRES